MHNWNILNNWIWIIVWGVQFIFWEFRFGALLPYIRVMLPWGCRGRVMLLVCHPLSPCHGCCHSHACHEAEAGGAGWVGWTDLLISKNLACVIPGVWERAFHVAKETYSWCRTTLWSLPERGYGQMDRDVTTASDPHLCEGFAGLIHIHYFRTQLTRLIFVQCNVSLLEFHTSSLVFPWTFRMWHKSSPWFTGGLTSLSNTVLCQETRLP